MCLLQPYEVIDEMNNHGMEVVSTSKYRVYKHRKEFLIFKLQGEKSIPLIILRYFSNLDISTIQHRTSDLSEYKVLMLIFQIEVKYEFVTKIIKLSDQKVVKCLKLKILWGF